MLLKLSPAVFSTEPLVHLVPHVAMFGCARGMTKEDEKKMQCSQHPQHLQHLQHPQQPGMTSPLLSGSTTERLGGSSREAASRWEGGTWHIGARGLGMRPGDPIRWPAWRISCIYIYIYHIYIYIYNIISYPFPFWMIDMNNYDVHLKSHLYIVAVRQFLFMDPPLPNISVQHMQLYTYCTCVRRHTHTAYIAPWVLYVCKW